MDNFNNSNVAKSVENVVVPVEPKGAIVELKSDISDTVQNNDKSADTVLCVPVPVPVKKPKRTDDEIFSSPNRHIWIGGRCPFCD